MKVKEYIKESIDVKNKILSNNIIIDEIEKIADIIVSAYKNNKKVLIAGNGGSASDSNHIAAEFVSKFKMERKPLAALSLASNQSILTAIANDYDFSEIFSKQIEAQCADGDIFIGISTSGKSKNIIKAFKKAKELNIVTIFLSGENADFEADFNIKVPSCITSIIQEAHIMISHIICALVEEKLFN